MSRLPRFTAVCVGLLLVAAPGAWACGEFSATATSRCPMAEMPGPISTSICHACGQMSGDCCDIRPAPEPTQALTFGSTGLLTALEVTDLEVVAPLAPAVLPPCSALADAFRLHNLGRYTLFSSLLL